VPKPAATSAGETSPRIAHLPGSGVATDSDAALTYPAATPVTGKPPVEAKTRWQLIVMMLAGAFALGVAIAWGAIAIGADIVGFWPRGFAFYAMLAGGGATMMLTAGLMAALFYSDTSGHDAAVHDFKPDQARRPPQRR
jgi:hypothetical protein